jgi:hypothetical protein
MSSKVKEIVYSRMEQVFLVMKDCFAEHKTLPMLMLLYSSIDIMSSLAREHNSTNRKAFVKWVKKYLLPDSSLSCSAMDLYSARCALLHSLSTESDLSRNGKAIEIYYAWGKGDISDLNKYIHLFKHKAVGIHIDELFTAFRKGIDGFIDSIKEDSAQEGLIVLTLPHLPYHYELE